MNSGGRTRACGLPAPTTTMGRPQDDQARRMPPLNSPRRWAWRAVLSALAGGGLTAAGLAPGPAGALAAETPAGTSSEGSATSNPGDETATQPPTSTTTSTPAPTPPTPTPSSTAPTPTGTTGAETKIPAPAAPPSAVVVQRR